jgi:hypothetical protein
MSEGRNFTFGRQRRREKGKQRRENGKGKPWEVEKYDRIRYIADIQSLFKLSY